MRKLEGKTLLEEEIWFNEIQQSHKLVFNGPRIGASKTETTDDRMIKTDDIVLANNRLKLSEVAKIFGSLKTKWCIFYMKVLNVRKFMSDNKRSRKTI